MSTQSGHDRAAKHVPFKKDDRGSDIGAAARAALDGGLRLPGPDRHDPRIMGGIIDPRVLS